MRANIALYSFWKPIHRPVRSAPLLICDPFSIDPIDLVACDVVSSSYFGESNFVYYSRGHRWLWFSDQEVDEALIFVSFDTHPQGGTGGRLRCDTAGRVQY